MSSVQGRPIPMPRPIVIVLALALAGIVSSLVDLAAEAGQSAAPQASDRQAAGGKEPPPWPVVLGAKVAVCEKNRPIVNWIDASATFFGSRIGRESGEPFHVHEPLGLQSFEGVF